MTEYEEAVLTIIFNENRLNAGIRLRHAKTGSFLKSNLEGLSTFVGRRKEDGGGLILRFDSVDGMDDYCVRLSDICLFWIDRNVYVSLSQARELIRNNQR